MVDITVTIIAISFYAIATLQLIRRLSRRDAQTAKLPVILIGFVAIIAHALMLQRHIATDHGLNFGFSNMISLATWFVAGLLLLSSLRKPIENLGIMILPLAALSLTIQVTLPTVHLLSPHEGRGLGVHILFSILAYSLLGMAAVQAVLLSIQERHLHNRHPGGVIRALPPMETMETLLFQMLIVGFVLQTMSLISGFVYLEDMFAQHLAHKTILSIIAWTIFAILLWGHWKHGWRGRTAVRWTLSGFFTLLLAYFGSKYVLEIILKR